LEWRFPVSVRQVVMMGLVGKTGLFRRHSRQDQDYALQIMEKVGIMALADRPVGDLSGGQQQRTFIARALAARPRVLILDEPMVGVDEAGQHQFARLIHDLHQSLNLTVLVVSHDLQAVAAGCNRVACLNQRIHYHDAPGGLTQAVLREVFQHDIVPVLEKRGESPSS
jgi:zinc transport system ATP-binding protein